MFYGSLLRSKNLFKDTYKILIIKDYLEIFSLLANTLFRDY